MDVHPHHKFIKGKDGKIYRGRGFSKDNKENRAGSSSNSPDGAKDSRLVNLRWDKYGINKQMKRRRGETLGEGMVTPKDAQKIPPTVE